MCDCRKRPRKHKYKPKKPRAKKTKAQKPKKTRKTKRKAGSIIKGVPTPPWLPQNGAKKIAPWRRPITGINTRYLGTSGIPAIYF